MAIKREQILVYLVSMIESLSSIKTVDRKQPADMSEIEGYSVHQMPLVAVLGGVPVPTFHKDSTRGGRRDVVQSKLEVKLYTYFRDNKTPDSTMSTLMNDIWVKLLSDQTLGGLAAQGMELLPSTEVASWEPYMAFLMTANYYYIHDTGGI